MRLDQFWRACTETLFLQNKRLICPNWDWDRITGRPAAAFVKHKRPEFWAPTDVATSKQFTPDYGPGCVHSSTNTAGNRAQIQMKIQSKFKRFFQWCKSRPCVTKRYFFNKTPDNGVGCVEISTRLGIQYKYNWKCNTNTMESAQQIYYKSTLNPVIVLWQNLQLHCSEIMLVNHSDHNRPLYGWKARNLQAEVLCKYKWKSGANTRENAVKQ